MSKPEDENLIAIEMLVAYLNAKAKERNLRVEFIAGTSHHADFFEIYVESIETGNKSSIYVSHLDPTRPRSWAMSDDKMVSLSSCAHTAKDRYEEIVRNLLGQKGKWLLVYDELDSCSVLYNSFLIEELTSKSLSELLLKLNVMTNA